MNDKNLAQNEIVSDNKRMEPVRKPVFIPCGDAFEKMTDAEQDDKAEA